jgi:hypothetical protein
VDGHLLWNGEAVGEVVGKVLEGLLYPHVEHLLPRLKPPKGELHTFYKRSFRHVKNNVKRMSTRIYFKM